MTWSRADKINACIAVIALVTAGISAVPSALTFWSHWHRPVAAFGEPPDGAKISGATTPVSGTSGRIPQDSDLWLVIRSDGRWYPIEKCAPADDGRWSFRADEVNLGDAGDVGIYILSLYLASPAQTGEFVQYVEAGVKTKAAGLSSLPDGIRLLKAISVNRVS
jgi:hypothetical protein